MSIDGEQFLREQVEASTTAMVKAIGKIREQYEIYVRAEKTARAFQSALHALLEETEKPYQPPILPTVNVAFQDHGNFMSARSSEPHKHTVRKAADEKATPKVTVPTSRSDAPRRMGKALDTSSDTPTGAVRGILKNAGKDITINEILEAAPASSGLTRDLIYRVLPRMRQRGEVIRADKGTYRYNQTFKDKGDESENDG